MSIINDALRRAKDAQQQSPPTPPSSLRFRPAEPAPQARHGTGLTGPTVWAIVALAAIVFASQWTRTRESTGLREARALAPAAVNNTSALQSASAPVALAAPAPVLAAGGAAATATPVATSAPASSPDTHPAESETVTAPVIAMAPPKPAPLRLQAIVYNPKRPSVLISGKTLFIGDKLGDLRVAAIDQESATLVGVDQTNVFSLPK